MRTACLLGAIPLLLLFLTAPSWAGGVDDLKQAYEAREFTGADGGKLLYRLMKPQDYQPTKKYPLVLFLHGAGGRGGDNWGQVRDQPIALQALASEELRAKFPCFVAAPQCPGPKQWVAVPWSQSIYSQAKVAMTPELKRVSELVGQLQKEFSLDPSRLYVTGISMGGYGTWDLIEREPKRFAAAIPICGGGDPSRAAEIAHMPIWAFHGSDDPVVPVRGDRALIAALKKAGGDPKYGEFDKVGHGSWIKGYQTQGLWDWLFAQKLATQ